VFPPAQATAPPLSFTFGDQHPMRTADYYDRVYFDGPGKSNYHRYSIDSSPFAAQADAIIDLMAFHGHGLNGPVLDIGCAKGYLVYVLRQRGVEAYGIDWSQYALDHAYPDARPYLQRACATRLPFPDKHFAVVTTFDVLEHLNEDHALLALRESARVSDRQLHQVNTGRLPEWVYEGDDSHCLKYSLRRWRSLARSLGLDHTYVCEPDRRLPFEAASARQG
jgi:SAM-dependent methyltransferase